MIYRSLYITPDGYDDLIMESDGTALKALCFKNSSDISKLSTREVTDAELDIFDAARAWLDVYFSGRDPGAAPNCSIDGLTPFRARVIAAMNEIPFGQTVTYGDIAKRLAAESGIESMSAQAVGGAVGWNPLCIIVPCHRVVGAYGALTGYGGGIKNKVKLLENEGHDMTRFSLPR